MIVSSKKSIKDKKQANLAAAAKSHQAGGIKVSHFPLVFYLEPTSICNLSCPMCPVAMGVAEYQYPEKVISMDLIEKMMGPLEYGLRVFLSGGGEPLLHPQFLRIIQTCKKLGLEIIFNTNATLVNKEFAQEIVNMGVDCVSISIDAVDPALYHSLRRGAELDWILDSIRVMQQVKKDASAKKPYLNMQFTLMKENRSELESLPGFASRLGISHLVIEPLSPVFSFDRQYQDFFREHYQPKSADLVKTLRGLEKEAKSLGLFFSSHYLEDARSPRRCVQPWINFGVRTNGKIFLCCGTAEKMGSLQESGFDEIWNGPAYRLFRSEISRGSYPEPCRFCLSEARSPFFNSELLEK